MQGKVKCRGKLDRLVVNRCLDQRKKRTGLQTLELMGKIEDLMLNC